MNGTHANRKKRAATLNAVALNLLVCDSFSRLIEACTWDKKNRVFKSITGKPQMVEKGLETVCSRELLVLSGI